LRRAAGAQLRQCGKASEQEQEDSPDKVMDVAAADDDVSERTDVVGDGGDEESCAEEGDEEADRGEEQPFMRPVGDLLMKHQADLCEVQQQKSCGSHQADEDYKNPRTGNVHGQRLPRLVGIVFSSVEDS
jgi:hypothetical protein